MYYGYYWNDHFYRQKHNFSALSEMRNAIICSQSDEVSTISWIQNNFIEIVKKKKISLSSEHLKRKFFCFLSSSNRLYVLEYVFNDKQILFVECTTEGFFWRSMITKKSENNSVGMLSIKEHCELEFCFEMRKKSST